MRLPDWLGPRLARRCAGALLAAGGLESPAAAQCGGASNPHLVFAHGFESGGAGAPGLPPGSSLRVLWVGNSLTDTPPDFNDYSLGPLPNRLAPMLAECGITLISEWRIQGGAEFSSHAANSATLALVGDPRFDAVNLQGYYQGYGSADAFVQATESLVNAASAAGSDLFFEGMWPYLGDPGSPQHPTAALAVEGAADRRANAFAVQVGRAWRRVLDTAPALHAKLRSDSTHQSAVGEYLNALVYTRFLSGRSVAGIVSISSQAAARLSASERSQLKAAVDSAVDRFYQPGSGPSVGLDLQLPAPDAAFGEGASVLHRAQALDRARGDISAEIRWLDASGAQLHVGAQFNRSPPVGRHRITARVTGSDGVAVAVERSYRVLGASNGPPIVSDLSRSVPSGSSFTQINLSAHADDLEGSVDWTSLQIDLTEFRGVRAAQNARDPFTVDVDYSNGFVGADRIRWRVADDQGAVSAWATINLDVR
jgi:hypothetical protein